MKVTVASGLQGEAEVDMQLSTLRIVDPVKGLLIYRDSLASYLADCSYRIVMKNRIRRGRGKQEGTQYMRYNVPVH